MRVLIMEPHADGHHGPYLEWMVKGLLAHKLQVTVVTLSEALQHPSLQALVSIANEQQQNGLLQIVPMAAFVPTSMADSGIKSLVAREIRYWLMFRNWYQSLFNTVQPEVVFLPYLDYCLYAIGLLGSPFRKCPWVGLAMRPSFHYQEVGVMAPQPSAAKLKKALFFRMLNNKHLRCLLTIDEPLVEYLSKNTKRSNKTLFLPEPADFTQLPNTEDAKQQLSVPLERKIILVYGAITARKGVLELLQALACPSFPHSVDVLLAGKIDPEIRQQLMNAVNTPLIAQQRIRLLDRFIEPEEEALLFAAADIVWLGYRGHYSASGVLVQAASAGRPVLACEEGIIGWLTIRHCLGQVVNPQDTTAVCNIIHDTLKSSLVLPKTSFAASTLLKNDYVTANNILLSALIMPKDKNSFYTSTPNGLLK